MTVLTVSLRDRRQITLPAETVAAVGLELNDALEVSVVNRTILLTPTRTDQASQRSMSRFLGVAKQAFGGTADQADAIVAEERNAW